MGHCTRTTYLSLQKADTSVPVSIAVYYTKLQLMFMIQNVKCKSVKRSKIFLGALSVVVMILVQVARDRFPVKLINLSTRSHAKWLSPIHVSWRWALTKWMSTPGSMATHVATVVTPYDGSLWWSEYKKKYS